MRPLPAAEGGSICWRSRPIFGCKRTAQPENRLTARVGGTASAVAERGCKTLRLRASVGIPGLPLKAFRFALLACSQKAKRRHDSLVASSATGRAPPLSLSVLPFGQSSSPVGGAFKRNLKRAAALSLPCGKRSRSQPPPLGEVPSVHTGRRGDAKRCVGCHLREG